MIFTILLSIAPAVAPTTPTLGTVSFVQAEDVEAKIAAAGEDTAKLLELAESYSAADEDDAARQVYRRVLEVDSENEVAHKALRHHLYDGKWFESYAKLSKYRREEAKRMKEEFGLVRFNDDWVPEVDLPYLRMGWTKREDGSWVSQHELDRKKKTEELTAAGWKQQSDMTWVSPDEMQNWEKGLWKVGEEWMTGEAADAYHSQLGKWWTTPGQHFIAYSTCDRDTNAWVIWWADYTYNDLVRIFGVEPEEKPHFFCVNGMEQYNEFSAGSQANQLPPTEIDGFSSLHYAYFAESYFDVTVQPPEYKGAGVAYWDPNFGPLAVRHAAAQSYVEAIDPSWHAISQFISNAGGGQNSTDAFWAEKKIPRWMRYGAASYVERYFHDTTAGEEGNPWRMRDFAFGELEKAGGLDELDKIFAFRLDLNDIPGSTQLIHEAGLIVSFILDGDCRLVSDAHWAFKEALRTGGDVRAAATELESEIKANADKLLAYSGLSIRKPAAPAVATEAQSGMAEAGTDGAHAGGGESGDAGGSDG